MKLIVHIFLLSTLLSFSSWANKKTALTVEQNEVAQLQRLVTNVIIEMNLGDKGSDLDFFSTILKVVINESYARATIKCIDRGGWPSFKENKKCVPGSKYASNRQLKVLGPTYNKNMWCNEKGVFRCNPVIYGTGQEGRDRTGFCVEASSARKKEYTERCLEKAQENYPQSLEFILNDPGGRERFFDQIRNIVDICSREQWSNDSCSELRDYVVRNVNTIKKCFGNESVADLLPEIELPVKFEEWIKVQENLEGKEILKSIERYSNSKETQNMISKLQHNFTKYCKENPKCRGSKVNKPTGKCFKYVKHGMMAGNFTDLFEAENKMNYPYTSSPSAKYAGRNLLEVPSVGFKNLLDIDAFSELTPYTAPKGAILVYEGGKHGHIEVKTDDGEFISDYRGEKPIYDEIPSLSGRRKLIGVYVKLD